MNINTILLIPKSTILNVVIVSSDFVCIKYLNLGSEDFAISTCDIFEITDYAQDDISPSKTITAHL